MLGELKAELNLLCSESRLSRNRSWEAELSPEEEGDSRFRAGASPMYRKSAKYGRKNGMAVSGKIGISRWKRRQYELGTPLRTNSVDSASLQHAQNDYCAFCHAAGRAVCYTYESGTTKDRFLEYLHDCLLPTLREDDMVVMDNLSTHHTKKVENHLRSVGAILRYLPLYSPDLNPIEKCGPK